MTEDREEQESAHERERRVEDSIGTTVPFNKKVDEERECPQCGTRMRPIRASNTTNAVCTNCGSVVPP